MHGIGMSFKIYKHLNDSWEIEPAMPKAGVLPALPTDPGGPRSPTAAFIMIMHPTQLSDIEPVVHRAVSAGISALEYDCILLRSEAELALPTRPTSIGSLLAELRRHDIHAPLLCHARDSRKGYMWHKVIADTYSRCGGPICAWVISVICSGMPSAVAVLEVTACDTSTGNSRPHEGGAVHVYLLQYMRERHTLVFHECGREYAMKGDEALRTTHGLRELVACADTVHARTANRQQARYWTDWLRHKQVTAATQQHTAERRSMPTSDLFVTELPTHGADREHIAAPLQMLAERLHERLGVSCGFCAEGLGEGLSLDAGTSCAAHLCKWVQRLGGARIAHVQRALREELDAVVARTQQPRERVVRRLLSDVSVYTTAARAAPISAYTAAQALHRRTADPVDHRRADAALNEALQQAGAALPSTEREHVHVGGVYVSHGAAPGAVQRWKAAAGLYIKAADAGVGLLEMSVRRAEGSRAQFDGRTLVFVRLQGQPRHAGRLLVYDPLPGPLKGAAPAVIGQLRPRALSQSTDMSSVLVYRGQGTDEEDCFVRSMLCLGWVCKEGVARAEAVLRALWGQHGHYERWNSRGKPRR